MKTRVDQQLRDETLKFRLHFSCRHCVYFDDVQEVCSEEYPIEEHLSAELEREELLFCKLFEGGI